MSPVRVETLWELLAGVPADTVVLRDADRDETVPAAALVARALAAAGALAAEGVRPGDAVVVQLPQSPALVTALFALARLGAVAVPLHPAVPPVERDRVARDCGATRIVDTPLDPAAPDAAPARDAVLPPPPRPDAVAALFYTSGSTGRPKGVVHVHADLARCGRDIAGYLGLHAGDRLLGLLPLAFHYGFSQLTSALAARATLVLTRVALPGELLATVARERLTTVALVPSAFDTLAAAQSAAGLPLPDLRLLTCAGGGLPPAGVTTLGRVFPGAALHRFYGTTEALRTLHHPAGAPVDGPGVLGRPVPGVRVALLNGDRVCAPGEEGELVHAGAFVAAGYRGDPDATAARFRPCPALGAERACWTGDRAIVDEHGVYWFRGRADAVLKSGGFRVGPEEIEAALLALPEVAEAVAFGVPDAVAGVSIEAVVRLREPTTGEPRALLRRLREVLPSYAVPRRVHVWDTLPHGPNGKVLRAEVARMARREGPAEG